MRIATWMAAAAATLAAGCISVRVDEIHSSKRRTPDTGFIAMTTYGDGEEQPAVLYVPDDYDPGQEWPLIVFLHGAGERGYDGWRQTEVGIGKAIRWNPDRFPALVFMPQCPPNTIWHGSIPRLNATDTAAAHIDDGIRQVLDRYNIDEDRITLTGLSLGGFGTFSYGSAHINRFAALMPICGGGDVEDAETLAKVPIWVFHGGDDPVVPPSRSREMVEAIEAAGGSVRYTEYPGVGHNSWDDAYGTAEAIEWLIAQRR